MAEYWVSKDNYWCKMCKCWIKDNKSSRLIHEQGGGAVTIELCPPCGHPFFHGAVKGRRWAHQNDSTARCRPGQRHAANLKEHLKGVWSKGREQRDEKKELQDELRCARASPCLSFPPHPRCRPVAVKAFGATGFLAWLLRLLGF